MINWYPIIKGNCNKCSICIDICPIKNLILENNQLQVKNGYLCPENCIICSQNCSIKAIVYYDGTEESILQAFSGSCQCHKHK